MCVKGTVEMLISKQLPLVNQQERLEAIEPPTWQSNCTACLSDDNRKVDYRWFHLLYGGKADYLTLLIW